MNISVTSFQSQDSIMSKAIKQPQSKTNKNIPKQSSFTSLNQVPQDVMINLTQFEKDLLEKFFKELNSIANPAKPLNAFALYLKSDLSNLKRITPNKAFSYYERVGQSNWKKEDEAIKAIYETQAETQFKEYVECYQVYSANAENLREKIDEIINRADISQIVKKKISPYRVYKKESASAIKAEFPNMRSQERQMIVKERWRQLTDQQKVLYVVKARLEEEKLAYTNIQNFYKSRIEYCRSLQEAQITYLTNVDVQEQIVPLQSEFSKVMSLNEEISQTAVKISPKDKSTTPSISSKECCSSPTQSQISDSDYSKDQHLTTLEERQKIFDYEQTKRIVDSTLRIIGLDDNDN
ncbi:UNKNOWN [Stylonychia lemnae]|uniref:HMG box domain-containing protein n=1 Tax=Stylonychia lemnae TaxID=5949 RepID=A0A078ACE0_STYLE|nr:UNKNOWN [Stylonychia lemnae]|eukprot:CDW79511.1 UNKNOWN [Stylonychia lemnae]